MTRQQIWATKAYEHVVRENNATDTRKKYATHCKKAAVLVQQSGLVQALAFLRSRDDKGKDLVDNLASTWAAATRTNLNGEQLFAKARTAPLPEYMALTRDLIDVAIWFRRFVQSEMADIKDGD